MNANLRSHAAECEELLFHKPTQQVCLVKRSNCLGGEVFDTVETADCSRISALLSEFRPATNTEIEVFHRAAARIRPCLLEWA